MPMPLVEAVSPFPHLVTGFPVGTWGLLVIIKPALCLSKIIKTQDFREKYKTTVDEGYGILTCDGLQHGGSRKRSTISHP